MAGVLNKTERQIGIMLARGGVGGNTVVLNPGFNAVDDKVWEEARKNAIELLDAGVLMDGAKRTREEELIARKVEEETNALIHEHPVTEAAASLIPGEAKQAAANKVAGPAVAVGAGAGGADVVETKNATAPDDLLG